VNVRVAVLAAASGLAALLYWANRKFAKAHSRFTPTDVEIAVAEFLDPSAPDHDTFDRFLQRPIDDPYLESIRLQCLTIRQEYPPSAGKDINEEGAKRIAALLAELRRRLNPAAGRSGR
jgi:hypothetical protein